ncbi:hypothetical protein C8J57DRAFT_1289343 [Mycena rebaudengoi]|nr:hypothetical protein C8J57DRAFT_1289343 [Mycena rebaudengoi]
MLSFNMIAALFSLATSLPSGWAQSEVTAVTLWQFGQGRLLSAEITLPLEPMGTASDGSKTTYLYQALNNVVFPTTESGIVVTRTTAAPTPRTVVVSASGWFEGFGPSAAGNISCNLINSEFGACTIGTVIANSGVPIAEVLQVALSANIPSRPSTTEFTFTPTSSTSASNTDTNPTKKPPPVAVIIGATIGVLAAIATGLAILLWLRKRRLRRVNEGLVPHAYPVPSPSRMDQLAGSSITTAPRPQVATAASVRKSRPPDRRLRSSGSSTGPAQASNSLGDIVDRLRRLEARASMYNEEPPPNYPGKHV